MKTLLTVLAACAFVGLTLSTDFTPPPPTTTTTTVPPTLEYSLVWGPEVTTDCQTWTISQSAAALEDVWPQVDHMTINGEGEYGPDPVTLPWQPGQFEFAWVSNGQVVLSESLTVRTTC